MTEKFQTPSKLKERFIKSLSDRVPSHQDFHVLKEMQVLSHVRCTLWGWYDHNLVWRGKTEDVGKSRKRKKDADETDTPLSKREKREHQHQKAFDELKKSIQTKYIQILNW